MQKFVQAEQLKNIKISLLLIVMRILILTQASLVHFPFSFSFFFHLGRKWANTSASISTCTASISKCTLFLINQLQINLNNNVQLQYFFRCTNLISIAYINLRYGAYGRTIIVYIYFFKLPKRSGHSGNIQVLKHAIDNKLFA